MDVGGLLANKALENRRVLGIDGDEPSRFCHRHKKVTAADDGLLIRVGKDFVCAKRRVTRVDTGKTNEGVDNDVDVRKLCESCHSLVTDA